MKPTGIEIRTTTATNLRAAGAGKDMVVEGTAASYNVLSNDLGGFKETIAPGAFDLSLSDPQQDVKCLIQHDASKVLGRKANGTLTVWSDARGLQFRCVLDPNNSDHANAYASIRRGDLSECSFAFTVPPDGDSWAYGTTPPTRTLLNVNLFDVSAVSFPAYGAAGATQVSARALAAAKTRKSGTPVSDAVGDRIRRDRAAELGNIIAGDKRTSMDAFDVSSARETMRLDEALKAYHYRLISHDDEYLYGVPADYDGPAEEEDCTRFHYQIDAEGNIVIDNDREIFHGWVKDAGQAARARYYQILPERRRAFADAELKRRMQSAAGIFIAR
jgi:HK97 family phage prohead protease